LRWLLGLCVSAGLAAGCGGIAPAAFCNEFQVEICSRVFECYTPDEQASDNFQATYGASQADCVNKLEAAAACATANAQPCATPGQSFHSDKAESCEKDLKAASCDAIADMNGMMFQSTNCMTICS
jgi:hypothetical protein